MSRSKNIFYEKKKIFDTCTEIFALDETIIFCAFIPNI